MIIKTRKELPSSEITDPLVFQQRRTLIKAAMSGLLAGAGIASAYAAPKTWGQIAKDSNSALKPTPAEIVKSYTNYYEFTFNKDDATALAQNLRIDPWSVEIGGAVEKPGTYALEDLFRQQTLEERIYRFRCVEAWSMVVPWVGFPLSALLKRVAPLSSAKFVKFTTVYQPENMPKQRANDMLNWPYTEGLRMDEAMHPLTIMAVGLYGDALPKQNGAPLRLVVPWKYGFKSIKAVVKIELMEPMPPTSWSAYAPYAYGFYANVNPAVPHPHWSQSSERQLGSGFFTARRKTELFNGYAEQVVSLYSGMDLTRFY